MTWIVGAFFIILGVAFFAFGLLVLRGYYLNAQMDELIEERKAAREEARRLTGFYVEGLRERAEARRIAREHEERRLAAE